MEAARAGRSCAVVQSNGLGPQGGEALVLSHAAPAGEAGGAVCGGPGSPTPRAAQATEQPPCHGVGAGL